MKNKIIATIVALVIGLAIGFAVKPATPVPAVPSDLGGLSERDTRIVSLEVTGLTKVKEFTQGGGCETLTDANGGTYTLTQTQMVNSNCFKFEAGGAGQATIALTLPATSTLTTLIPNVGDTRSWFYDASALAAATTTTITAGTGIDLIAYTTNDDVIDGAEFAEIKCWRQQDSDVTCLTSELLHAD